MDTFGHRSAAPQLLAALIAVGMAGCSAGGGSPGDIHIDFRGRPLPLEVHAFGPLQPEQFQPEAEGLRISLPKNRPELSPVGLDVATKVTGDCEITAVVEILEAERSDVVNPSRVGVFLTANQAARVGYLANMDGAEILWERFTEPDGSRSYTSSGVPCSEPFRRLRLRRVGSVMQFAWSPRSDGDDFRDVGRCEFGDGDITLVRLRIEKGERVGRLDLRLAELRISGPNVALGRPPWAVAAIGVGVVLLTLTALVAVRRRMRGNRGVEPPGSPAS